MRFLKSFGKALLLLGSLALGPIIGLVCVKHVLKIDNARFELLKDAIQKGDIVDDLFSYPSAKAPRIGELENLEHRRSLDDACENLDDEFEWTKKHVCEPYHDVTHAWIVTIIGLALTPLVPLLLAVALASVKIRKRRRTLVRRGWEWGLLKVVNKIIGAKDAAVGLGVALSLQALGAVWSGYIVALFVVGFLYAMEDSAVKLFTKNKMQIEVEGDPSPEMIKAFISSE